MEAKYEQDFLKWTEQQIECLQHRDWGKLDVENLIEELEALGRSEQKELGSHLQVLIMHLLKWEYQPDRQSRSWETTISSWETTISNCRDRLQDCIEDTPSLRRFLLDREWVGKYYRRACRDAVKETEQLPETFLIDCPYSIAQILDPEFLP